MQEREVEVLEGGRLQFYMGGGGQQRPLSKVTLGRVLKEVKECALQIFRETVLQAQGRASANVLREEGARVFEEHTTGTESEEVGILWPSWKTQQTWPSHRGLARQGVRACGPLPCTSPLLGSETPRVCVRFSLPASAKLLVAGVTCRLS